MIKVTLVKSRICCTPNQRRNLDALGLHKIRQEKSFEDTPVVRGMIAKVVHLVEVAE